MKFSSPSDAAGLLAVAAALKPFGESRRAIAEAKHDAERRYLVHQEFNRFDEMRKMGEWVDFYAQVDLLASSLLAAYATGSGDLMFAAVLDAIKTMQDGFVVASRQESTISPTRASVVKSTRDPE